MVLEITCSEIPQSEYIDLLSNPLLPCFHQAGGHTSKGAKAACLIDEQGRFFKAMQVGPRGIREWHVYKVVKDASHDSAVHLELAEEQLAQLREDCTGLINFIPKYCGVYKEGNDHFLVLEDFAHGYKQPCTLDLKVGFCTYYSWATEKDQVKCREKDAITTQHTLGFRVTGYSLHKLNGTRMKTDKKWSAAINVEDVPHKIREFTDNGALTFSDVFCGPGGFIELLKGLEKWAHSQRSLKFFAASVILLYDGTATTPDDAKPKLCLVDFAHTYFCPGEEDSNFATGLHSLIQHLEHMVEEL